MSFAWLENCFFYLQVFYIFLLTTIAITSDSSSNVAHRSAFSGETKDNAHVSKLVENQRGVQAITRVEVNHIFVFLIVISFFDLHMSSIPACIYLFNFNNRNARNLFKVNSKDTNVVLVSLLLSLNRFLSLLWCFHC